MYDPRQNLLIGCSEAAQLLASHVPKLTPGMKSSLGVPITAEELEASIWGMNPFSSPGPDGLTAGFWQTIWSQVAPTFLLLCQHVITTGRLPSSMTKGLIRLLYKGKGSELDPRSYRPITLLPVHYKIVSKVWANRW